MDSKIILVIGSSNTDMVIQTKEFPAPGETILGGHFFMNPGGKGANQAVAAQRLGGKVSFLGKIGNDVFGNQAKQLLKDEGIDVSHVCVDMERPSGVALITVNSLGENSIVVASGSNGSLSRKNIEQAISEIERSEIILIQLEIPLETVEYVVEIASKISKKVILNPAPANKLADSLLRKLYMITPNETEAEILTGIRVTNEESALQAAQNLRDRGVEIAIITMGAAGAFVLSNEYKGMISSPKVKAIDTTAAGDTFNGALVVAISEKKQLRQAIEFACKAASISVTKLGAQSSIPYRKDIIEET